MAVKGQIRVLRVGKDGLWVVEPVGSHSQDVLMASGRSGVPINIRLSEPVTKSGKAKRRLPQNIHGGLRLVGGDNA